ncbi:MAG: carboxypeptidase-like regulatory domain-containing protein [Pyrinomonadaceae bacterium]
MKNMLLAILITCLFSFVSLAQDKTTGGVKGAVKNTSGNKIAGVTVEARQNGMTVATAQTNGQGDFTIANLKPGVYRFIFNKTGLSEGVSGDVEVKAGTILKLSRLILGIDKGTLALVRGSVFDTNGRIVRGAKIEISRITGDSLKKMGEKYTDDNGEFAIRLPSETARYRISANINGMEPATKDFEFSGGEAFRIALTLKAKQ